jgi:hypothetical protein
MSDTTITCPACGLQASENVCQLSSGARTRTIQRSHRDVEQLCRHLERKDESLHCVVWQRTIDGVSPKVMLLKGKDTYHLDQQQWAWQTTANPGVLIVKKHDDETLPLQLHAPRFGTKIEAQDRVTRRIEYCER